MKYIVEVCKEFKLLFLLVVPFIDMLFIGIYLDDVVLLKLGLVVSTFLLIIIFMGIVIYWLELRSNPDV